MNPITHAPLVSFIDIIIAFARLTHIEFTVSRNPDDEHFFSWVVTETDGEGRCLISIARGAIQPDPSMKREEFERTNVAATGFDPAMTPAPLHTWLIGSTPFQGRKPASDVKALADLILDEISRG